MHGFVEDFLVIALCVFQKVYHPDLPKRPLPSFMKYRNEQHHKISVKHPTLPREEIEQKVRRKFDRLSDEKKVFIRAI